MTRDEVAEKAAAHFWTEHKPKDPGSADRHSFEQGALFGFDMAHKDTYCGHPVDWKALALRLEGVVGGLTRQLELATSVAAQHGKMSSEMSDLIHGDAGYVESQNALSDELDKNRQALVSARETIKWCCKHHMPVNALSFAEVDRIDKILYSKTSVRPLKEVPDESGQSQL